MSWDGVGVFVKDIQGVQGSFGLVHVQFWFYWASSFQSGTACLGVIHVILYV